MSEDEFRKALPDKLKKSVNISLMQQINQTLADPAMYEEYRDNLLSYTTVMQEGKFKVSSYIEAVKYISHKLRGLTNVRAYELTFPAKIQRWVAQGVVPKDIASYVSSYNKSKLINLIYEQTMMPVHVLNQDLYQRALNTQADLMVSAHSEMVRTTAANSLLTQLKPPETKKFELDIKATESSAVAELRVATAELAAVQRRAIEAGQMKCPRGSPQQNHDRGWGIYRGYTMTVPLPETLIAQPVEDYLNEVNYHVPADYVPSDFAKYRRNKEAIGRKSTRILPVSYLKMVL